MRASGRSEGVRETERERWLWGKRMVRKPCLVDGRSEEGAPGGLVHHSEVTGPFDKQRQGLRLLALPNQPMEEDRGEGGLGSLFLPGIQGVLLGDLH